MIIHFKRHLKVDFTWSPSYNSTDFNLACKEYDSANIIITPKSEKELIVPKIYRSTLLRTKQTVENITTNCSNIEKTELLNEVPIKAFMETKRKLPVQLWLIMGRVQWFFDNNRQPEVKLETTHRIEKFIAKIEKNIDSEILIIGHGFYFSQMRKILKKRGFTSKRKTHLKNGETVTFTKIEF